MQLDYLLAKKAVSKDPFEENTALRNDYDWSAAIFILSKSEFK